MFVESENVQHIVTVAASFDWTWTEDDLTPICRALGWEGVVSRTTRIATLRTGLPTEPSEAYWCAWDQGGIGELIMVVTEKVGTNNVMAMEQLRDEYEGLVSGFTTVLGPPHDLQRGPKPQARWDRTNLVVRLFVLRGYLSLYLVNPAYQEWIDTPEDLQTH